MAPAVIIHRESFTIWQQSVGYASKSRNLLFLTAPCRWLYGIGVQPKEEGVFGVKLDVEKLAFFPRRWVENLHRKIINPSPAAAAFIWFPASRFSLRILDVPMHECMPLGDSRQKESWILAGNLFHFPGYHKSTSRVTCLRVCHIRTTDWFGFFLPLWRSLPRVYLYYFADRLVCSFIIHIWRMAPAGGLISRMERTKE